MTNSSEIEKQIQHDCPSHSEEEEESLSLCDLPLASIAIDQEPKLAKTSTNSQKGVTEDFDFGSLAASLDTLDSEMCAADDVFFRGQILPFRHSISSVPSAYNLTGDFSRSESMDRNAGSGFQSSSTASSSRSSSTRSSSINSSASAGKFPPRQSTNPKRESKIRNQFHSFPSPKPYAHASNTHRSSINSSTNKRSSALWEIFRLGPVRTPEIELGDLKFRCSKQLSRNSSSGGSENVKSLNKRTGKSGLRKKGMSLMSCKCRAEAVEPEKGKEVVNKVEGKHDVSSRHDRTFEWLKDLSHAVVLNDVST